MTLTGPLAVFKQAHPNVEIELHWSPADDMARRLRAQEVDLCVASQPIHADGLEWAPLFDEAVGLAVPLGHRLAGRTSVMIEELADEPFVTARKGHWIRRLLDRLFAARGLTPRIVCESDEHSAIADLISTGLGVGLVPAIARRSATQAPGAWIAVDSADCRRQVVLYWGAGSHLSAAARLMRTTVTGWEWGVPRG
ncbi:LysR substrate-binding domain-containing protein [Nonomuraea sp. NPDC050663]|uniref:LysR substrate-binding domain-containing protein n=1 Tax=Nonomuraea sp. NPDC050663 TaxID=3364370 RepID=UPI00379C79D9